MTVKRYTRCLCQDGDEDYFDLCCMEKYYSNGEVIIEDVSTEDQEEKEED